MRALFIMRGESFVDGCPLQTENAKLLPRGAKLDLEDAKLLPRGAKLEFKDAKLDLKDAKLNLKDAKLLPRRIQDELSWAQELKIMRGRQTVVPHR